MKRKYKPTILCMLLLISLVFGGSGWYNLVILDDAQHIMYENLAVDDVIYTHKTIIINLTVCQ